MSKSVENNPQHIAIIMDGNGRWANKKGEVRTIGHREGLNAVREAVKGCIEEKVKYLTLYAFSTENWNRPKEEVDFLMHLMIEALTQETEELKENGVKITAIGDIEKLPSTTLQSLKKSMKMTESESTLTLILALNYGSQSEIVNMVKAISKEVKEGIIDIDDITKKTVSSHLYTAGIPDPDLMIRTSKEYRLSNFLLWQLAYTELFFIEKLWPDFTKEDLKECIYNYKNRERRFGKTSHQLENE